VGKSVAGVIGDNSNALGEAGKTIAHGVTSGAIAEITGGKFAAGAAGGAVSELASDWSLGAFGGNEEERGSKVVICFGTSSEQI
jgi:filamentous hemagglutinin